MNSNNFNLSNSWYTAKGSTDIKAYITSPILKETRSWNSHFSIENSSILSLPPLKSLDLLPKREHYSNVKSFSSNSPPNESNHYFNQPQSYSDNTPRTYKRNKPKAIEKFMIWIDEGTNPSINKHQRWRVSEQQLEVLNATLKKTIFPTSEQRNELAKLLNLSPRTVQVWFQNRRQAIKYKQSKIN